MGEKNVSRAKSFSSPYLLSQEAEGVNSVLAVLTLDKASFLSEPIFYLYGEYNNCPAQIILFCESDEDLK